MRRAAILTAGSIAVTLYGFVPTGVVALGLSMVALGRASRGEDAGPAQRAALKWVVVTLFLGAAVEVPVLAAALIHSP